jgi:hypothetical protein
LTVTIAPRFRGVSVRTPHARELVRSSADRVCPSAARGLDCEQRFQQHARTVLSRLAHVLLIATSLAPIFLIYGVARVNAAPASGIAFIALAGALATLCHAVLWFAAKRGEIEQIQISKSKSLDKEAVTFVVTYALPLLVPVEQHRNTLALAVFVVLVFIVLFQLRVAHVNPVMALFGYHFFEVNPPSGETATLITRGNAAAGIARIVKLSDHIWLELSE